MSNHMHPNKGFKVWIETETVSAFGQQMQRKLAMFPLFARKAWKLGPLLCQRKREALIFLHTDFCKYWVPDIFLVWLVCLLLARCGPKPPGKDLPSTVNLDRLTWTFSSDYQFGGTFFPSSCGPKYQQLIPYLQNYDFYACGLSLILLNLKTYLLTFLLFDVPMSV